MVELGPKSLTLSSLFKKKSKARWPMVGPNAFKGNDRIRLMKIFLAFLTKAIPTDGSTEGPTNGPTDGWTQAPIEMQGRI